MDVGKLLHDEASFREELAQMMTFHAGRSSKLSKDIEGSLGLYASSGKVSRSKEVGNYIDEVLDMELAQIIKKCIVGARLL